MHDAGGATSEIAAFLAEGAKWIRVNDTANGVPGLDNNENSRLRIQSLLSGARSAAGTFSTAFSGRLFAAR
jgi:hypothetical protein